MLTELSKITNEHSVLVHAGLTCVGQAAIAVCLERKCQVFVTVLDSKQMELLKQRFPSVCITYYYVFVCQCVLTEITIRIIATIFKYYNL